MSKENVRHLVSNNFQLAQCATVSLAAILFAKPDALTLEALYGNTFSLKEIVAMTAYELLKQEIGIYTRTMDDDMQPSRFFRSTVHPLRHGKKIGLFIGGYMMTKGSPGIKHIVAITSSHEGNIPKVTVYNTGPNGTSRSVVKREPLDWLDRNIHPNDGFYSERAVALIGTRLDPNDEKTIEQIRQTQIHLRKLREAMLERKYLKKTK